jgi:peroxiredoxin
METHQPVPDFELPDLDQFQHRLSDHLGQIILLNFWSTDCPHSVRTDEEMVSALERWTPEVVLLSIASNSNEQEADLRMAAARRRVPLVLVDQGHIVADLFSAITTPHLFILDQQGILRYHGAVDDVYFGKKEVSRLYFQETVEALRSGLEPPLSNTQPFGCAILREF